MKIEKKPNHHRIFEEFLQMNSMKESADEDDDKCSRSRSSTIDSTTTIMGAQCGEFNRIADNEKFSNDQEK